jgi:hypothetical protein
MGGACSTHEGADNAYRIFVGKLKGTDHSEYTGVHGKIILEWILGKEIGKV